MAFRKVLGLTKTVWLPVTPSTALAAGSLVAFTSGKLVAATAVTTAPSIVGVLKQAITATDADYASNRLVPVEIPAERHVIWEFSGTGFGATDIGTHVDLTDASNVDGAATAVGVVLPTKILSSTKAQGFVKINGSY
jgi:hypothetical protein